MFLDGVHAIIDVCCHLILKGVAQSFPELSSLFRVHALKVCRIIWQLITHDASLVNLRRREVNKVFLHFFADVVLHPTRTNHAISFFLKYL